MSIELKTSRVLAVDDDPQFLELYTIHLAQAGHTVIPFKDAEEALSFLRVDPNRVDVIISDLYMRGLSGLDFVKDAREMGSTVPIGISSSRTDDLDPAQQVELQRHVDAIELKYKVVADPVSFVERLHESRRVINHLNANNPAIPQILNT